jgi:hypothetical protein
MVLEPAIVFVAKMVSGLSSSEFGQVVEKCAGLNTDIKAADPESLKAWEVIVERHPALKNLTLDNIIKQQFAANVVREFVADPKKNVLHIVVELALYVANRAKGAPPAEG